MSRGRPKHTAISAARRGGRTRIVATQTWLLTSLGEWNTGAVVAMVRAGAFGVVLRPVRCAGSGSVVASADDQLSSGSRSLFTAGAVIDVVFALALGWVLWVTFDAQARQVLAASGHGRPGVILIEGLRPARGADIPVGTFTEPDGTRTSQVAWQDRPAAVGDRKEGVRVGDRAWAPGVRFGLWDVLVAVTVTGLFLWRVLILVRRWRGRYATGPDAS